MVRKREAAGLALMAFGAGMVLSVVLQSGLCPIVIGLGALVAGGILVSCG